MNQKTKKFVLTPGYISGLTQTDGSFFCAINITPKNTLVFSPKFTITADLDSKYVLDEIQAYFNCGSVRVIIKNHTAEFIVYRAIDLQNIIIPHFIKYPVFCAKLHAFKLIQQIVTIKLNKKTTIENQRKMLQLSLSMNLTNNRTEERINLLYSILGVTKLEDKALIPILPSILKVEPGACSNDFISGIIDGDGSVFVSFQSNGIIKTGFNITSDRNSISLFEEIQRIFKGVGAINEGTKNELVYALTGNKHLTNIIIPFIDENPLFSERALHYEKFKTVTLFLKEHKPLDITLENKLEIVELCYNMNKGGKHRKYTKAEYIAILVEIHKTRK